MKLILQKLLYAFPKSRFYVWLATNNVNVNSPFIFDIYLILLFGQKYKHYACKTTNCYLIPIVMHIIFTV